MAINPQLRSRRFAQLRRESLLLEPGGQGGAASAHSPLSSRRRKLLTVEGHDGARIVVMLDSRQIRRSPNGARLSHPELLRRVGAALVEQGEELSAQQAAPQQQWQSLLEQGLQHKMALLNSTEFKTSAEAAKLLGVGEAAVRKRIRSGTLFALRLPGGDEKRIPLWALNPALSAKVTAELLREGADLDEWAFYSFMTTPHGRLHGLRPFEALLPLDTLSSEQRSARKDLAAERQVPVSSSMLPAVRDALHIELEDRPLS